jgi:hypothetical protein
MTNYIIEKIKVRNHVDYLYSTQMQYQIKLLKEELSNLRYSIHWAKNNIIDPLLLSKNEIYKIAKILENDKIAYHNLEQVIDFANVKVLANSSSLVFLISIPLTTKDFFSKILVKPIKIRNTINPCKSIYDYTICEPKSIINITNTTSKLWKKYHQAS